MAQPVGGSGAGAGAGGGAADGRRGIREAVGVRVRALFDYLETNLGAGPDGGGALRRLAGRVRRRAWRELTRRLPLPGGEVARAAAAGGNGAGRQPKGTGDAHAWEHGPGTPARAEEPRPEGFLVARVAGAGEAHRAPHVLTEEALAEPPRPSGPEEVGELPGTYGADTLVALPRDPATLWLFWDFAPATVERARTGLTNPRTKIRIFAGDRLVRDQDFALESRSFYVNELPPGGAYRAEIWFVGDDGERRLGWPAREVVLPRFGPSPVIDDRFATVPWGMPLSRRLDLFEKTTGEEGFAPEVRETLFEVSEGIRSAQEGGRAVWPSSAEAPHLGAPAAPRPEVVPARPRDTWSGARYERSAWSGDAGPRRE